MAEQPSTYSVPILDVQGREVGWRIEHDGPCVFVDHQCSCGRLDVGVTRTLCLHEHHDGHKRDDTFNKQRVPCPECGGTWVDFGRGRDDLGIVRDFPPGAVNDFEVFGERFEAFIRDEDG